MVEREELGRIVREAWVNYCHETGDSKPSHIAPWEEIADWDREVDCRIGEAIARHVAPPEPVVLTAEEQREFRIAVNDCPYGLEGDAAMDWFAEHGFALVRTKAVADGA